MASLASSSSSSSLSSSSSFTTIQIKATTPLLLLYILNPLSLPTSYASPEQTRVLLRQPYSSNSNSNIKNDDLVTLPLRYIPPSPNQQRTLQQQQQQQQEEEAEGKGMYNYEGQTYNSKEGDTLDSSTLYNNYEGETQHEEGEIQFPNTEGETTYNDYTDSGKNNEDSGSFVNLNKGPDDHLLQGGAGWGTHYVDVWFGNPAQKRTLAVLTNSDFTAFPCADCTECGNTITEKYDQSSSKTFNTLSCGQCISQLNNYDFEQQIDMCDMNGEACIASDMYADHSSWKAYEARDYAYVGGAPTNLGDDVVVTEENSLVGSDITIKYGFPLVFGCQTFAKGWFANQVQDGILGFSSAPSSFVNQMYVNRMLRRRKFALCFSEDMEKEEQGMMKDDDGPHAGIVTLGGYDPRLNDTPMSYAERIDESGYRVYVKKIYLREGGGRSVIPDYDDQKIHSVIFNAEEYNSKTVGNQRREGGGALVDSGTPYLLLDKSIEGVFQSAWRKASGGKAFSYGKLYLTKEEVAAMPTLILQLQSSDTVDRSIDPTTVANMAGDLDQFSPYDVLVSVPATHYLEYNRHGEFYRARISLQNEGTVLGANMMQGHNIVYDLESNRIGFAEASSCRIVPSSYATNVLDDDLFDAQMTNPETNSELEDDDLYLYEPGPGEEEEGNQYDEAEMGGDTNGEIPNLGVEGQGGEEDQNKNFGVTTKRTKVSGHGHCTSATCQSFIIVGYAFVATMLYVAYKLASRKDRSGFMDMFNYDDEEEQLDFDTEEITPVMRNNSSRRVIS